MLTAFFVFMIHSTSFVTHMLGGTTTALFIHFFIMILTFVGYGGGRKQHSYNEQ